MGQSGRSIAGELAGNSPISQAILLIDLPLRLLFTCLRFLHSNNSNWGHSTSMLHTSGSVASVIYSPRAFGTWLNKSLSHLTLVCNLYRNYNLVATQFVDYNVTTQFADYKPCYMVVTTMFITTQGCNNNVQNYTR